MKVLCKILSPLMLIEPKMVEPHGSWALPKQADGRGLQNPPYGALKGWAETFTFEHVTGIIRNAYNDLQHYGEPKVKTKKVHNLLNKFTGPKLESAKQVIQISEVYKKNFSMAINFLAQSVEP